MALHNINVAGIARLMALTICIGCMLALASATSSKPNVIILLTDDQDALLGSMQYQPNLRSKVREQGVFFEFGYSNTPVCCPARSSLLTGRFTHNHGALNNSVEGGCCSEKWYNERETDALAVHMKKAGYYSLYAGKYLNHYCQGGTRCHVPPGWSHFFGLHGNSRYYNYTVQDDHRAVKHGDNYTEDYFTDVLNRRAQEFLHTAIDKRQKDGTPFFLWIGTPAAHAPFDPAPQYYNTATGQKAMRTPSWNQVYQDRHQTMRELSPMTDEQISQSDRAYRQRLGTLRSVDDMIADIYDILEASGEDENTYFFYTGDNGFHLGQNAMGFDKRQATEQDTRVPYFVRGPGIPSSIRNSTLNFPVSHVDLAPTVLDIATGSVPSDWDGQSYFPVLQGGTEWRNETLLQYFGEGRTTETCGAGYNAYQSDGVTSWHISNYDTAPCDGVNNTWTCLTRVAHDLSVHDVFCEFTCFGHGRVEVPCPPDQAEGYGEYFDLKKDPGQTKNGALSLDNETKAYFQERIAYMRTCQGQDGCNYK